MQSTRCILVAFDIRSTHNVGAFFRTCDGLGIEALYLTGITPHPKKESGETRLPHLITKLAKDIHKTALGAESTLPWHYYEDATSTLQALKADGWQIIALEQDNRSVPLTTLTTHNKVALVVGSEVEGLAKDVLAQCDDITEIPMYGAKESFNVSVAAAIGLFWLKNH